MRINKILVENFGKFDKKEFDIRDKTLYIVSGRNGAGKSTFFVESLGWCLYGDLWRGGQRNDVIKDGEGWCRVVLFTDKGEVERRKERDKSSIVKIDGRVVDNLDVLNLVKLNKDMFFNSVVFGHALSGFLFLDDGERRELLAEVMYKDIDKVIERLKEKRKEIQDNRKVSEKELYVFDMQVENLNKELEDVKRKKERFENISEKVEILRDGIRHLNEEIKRIQEEMDSVLELKDKIEGEIDRLKMNLEERKRLFSVKDENLNMLIDKMRRIEGMSVCPTCEREVSDKHKRSLLKKIEIEKIEVEGDLVVLQQDIDRLFKEIGFRSAELKELKEKEMNLRVKLKEKLDELDRRRDELLSFEKTLVEVKELDKMIMKYEDNLNSLIEKRNEVRKTVDRMNIEEQACNYWIEVLTRYKVELFDKVLDVFDVVANEILMKLSDGRFKIELDIGIRGKKRVSEKFSIVLYDKGQSVVYSRLSGGEKRLVSLGLNVALNYILSKVYAGDFNLMVFDEVFDALDVRVRERVVDLLLEMVEKTGKAIVVITHDDFNYREDEFERVVLQ